MNVRLIEPTDAFVKTSKQVNVRNTFFLNNLEQKLANKRLLQSVKGA